jgi:hypothetical protein
MLGFYKWKYYNYAIVEVLKYIHYNFVKIPQALQAKTPLENG